MTLDTDTQQIIKDGEALTNFTDLPAWTMIKQMFTDRITDLQSVMNIDAKTPTDVAREVIARRMAVDYMFELLKDIEGKAQQYRANQSLIQDSIIQNI